MARQLRSEGLAQEQVLWPGWWLALPMRASSIWLCGVGRCVLAQSQSRAKGTAAEMQHTHAALGTGLVMPAAPWCSDTVSRCTGFTGAVLIFPAAVCMGRILAFVLIMVSVTQGCFHYH